MASLPILDKAMAEIAAVMDKYDLGGNVTIHRPGHWNFIFKVDTGYSVAKYDEKEGVVKFNMRAAHFGGDKKAAEEATADTVNLLTAMRDQTGIVYLQTDDLLEQLSKVMEIEHTGKVYTGEQDNTPYIKTVVTMKFDGKEDPVGIPSVKGVSVGLATRGIDDKAFYTKDGFPSEKATKPITMALMLGLITNVRRGALEGAWKEGDHMEFIQEMLTKFHAYPDLGIESLTYQSKHEE